MILDIDFLITFFEKKTLKSDKEEMREQEASTPPPSGGSAPASGGGSSTKSGKAVKKWETGLTRGHANQIGNTKWESGRKLGKTYMNDPKYVWKSDRNMGKTGGSDFA
jgi:hypothetical protein